MNFGVVIGLIVIATILFWSVRKGWIDNRTLETLADIAGIVALIAAVIVFVIPTPNQPEIRTTPIHTLSVVPLQTSTVTPSDVQSRVIESTATITPSQTLTQTPTPTLGIGSTKISPIDGATMLYIPAGEFLMGSNDNNNEMPPHTVYLDAYWMDKHEVSNAQYEKCVVAGECLPPWESHSASRDAYYGIQEFDEYPVIVVAWDDAKTYCEWAGKRLPTEAEWEKAARGTDGRIYPWGNQWDGTRLNYCDKSCDPTQTDEDGFSDTAPVGSFPTGASSYGIMNLLGNVWEWVADWYRENYYHDSPRENPTGPTYGQYHVLRGASWSNNQGWMRTSARNAYEPWFWDVGFRCVQSEEQIPTIVPTPRSGEERTIGDTLMVFISSGEFIIGSSNSDEYANPDEKPQYVVYLDAFWMDKFEVTNDQYEECVEAGVCSLPIERESTSNTDISYFGNELYSSYPVVYVEWSDAKTYCEWVEKRLPTEAEWEKASRGTDGRIYPWGNQWDGTRLNYCDSNCTLPHADVSVNDGYETIAPVGSYLKGASPYGILDLAGNVWEWVSDWYGENEYEGYPWYSPFGPYSGEYRVVRGGSWINGSNDVRAANINDLNPSWGYDFVGFRCVRSFPP